MTTKEILMSTVIENKEGYGAGVRWATHIDFKKIDRDEARQLWSKLEGLDRLDTGDYCTGFCEAVLDAFIRVSKTQSDVSFLDREPQHTEEH
jgi:hypothetical protein